MKPGRKPKPTALRRMDGNPGKRGFNPLEPDLPVGMPDCPLHLSDLAAEEWRRIAAVLHEAGILTLVDRAALAAYCQAWGRWVEAEEKLRDTPMLIRTPSGYVQQSPWLGIANRQMELMGRYMAELGLTPASRSRVSALISGPEPEKFVTTIILEAAPMPPTHPAMLEKDEQRRPMNGRDKPSAEDATVTVTATI